VDADVTRKLANDRGDAAYLRYLVQLCINHKFRLLLCNFEYAEAEFNQLNTTGKAVLWDVFYANEGDQHYGAKALVGSLRNRKLNADMFFVTGVQHTLDELKEKHTEPEWRVLDKISPILAKGRENLMRQKLEQFAADFSGRAGLDRFQFWARPGDAYWQIAFEGRMTIQPICVETAYLAVLVARPTCSIHERWLDMINEFGHESADEMECAQRAKQVRLFIVAEYLRRKVHDLSAPPSVVTEGTVTSIDGAVHSPATLDDTAAEVSDAPSHEKPALRAQAVEPLPEGCDSIGPLTPTPNTLRSHIAAMISECEERIFRLERTLENDPFAACQEDLDREKRHLSAAKQLLTTVESKRGALTKSTGNEIQKMHDRVQKAFGRARKFFDDLETRPGTVISNLAQHFTASLPQGRPRAQMVFRYSPDPTIQWSCRQPD